jgi:hypothetical protein
MVGPNDPQYLGALDSHSGESEQENPNSLENIHGRACRTDHCPVQHSAKAYFSGLRREISELTREALIR